MRYDIKVKIRHLCGYISDRSAVLNHINRDYGTSYKMRDLQEALLSAPRTRRKEFTEENALPLTPPVSTHDGRGYDPLAIALFKYHAARTQGEQKRYWEQKLVRVF
jgi:hypothetical protein